MNTWKVLAQAPGELPGKNKPRYNLKEFPSRIPTCDHSEIGKNLKETWQSRTHGKRRPVGDKVALY